MEPRLGGEIPIFVYRHNVRELKFSIFAACNKDGHSHQLGFLTFPRSEDREPDSPMANIYDFARRAFGVEGLTD